VEVIFLKMLMDRLDPGRAFRFKEEWRIWNGGKEIIKDSRSFVEHFEAFESLPGQNSLAKVPGQVLTPVNFPATAGSSGFSSLPIEFMTK